MAAIEKRKARKPKKSNPVYKVDQKWFLDRFRDAGLSLRKVAAKLDMNPSSLSRRLRGLERVDTIEAARLSSILGGVSPTEILAKLGAATGGIVDTAAAPVVGLLDSEMATLGNRPAILAPVTSPVSGVELHAMRFATGGSKLDHLHDVVVFFQPGRTVHRAAAGRLSVVRVEGQGERLLRVVRPSAGQRGRYDLADLMGRVSEKGVKLESALPVVWAKF